MGVAGHPGIIVRIIESFKDSLRAWIEMIPLRGGHLPEINSTYYFE